MKNLIRLAARLYPRVWRERYGVEFEAMIEDVQPDLRASFDIVKGALLMQITSWDLGRILVVSGMMGAVVAFGTSLAMPPKYVSQAVLKIMPNQPSSMPSTAIKQEATDHINSMSQTIFSRLGMAKIINTLGLYPLERSKMPIEDVVELMRENILIRPVSDVVDVSSRGPAFIVQFSYEDRHAAQRVTREIVSQYIDENLREARTSLPMTLELVDSPSLPSKPNSLGRGWITAMGLSVGLALGAAGAYLLHARRSIPAAIGVLEKNAGEPLD